MSNSNINVIHSLVDTIKNVASLTQVDYFVIFQGTTVRMMVMFDKGKE